MQKKLNILIIEDSEDDTFLLVRELRRAKYEFIYEQIYTAEDLERYLDKNNCDLVLCDYNLPRFDAFTAINILKRKSLDLPFIIVSGTIGEETAVKTMKAGAHDYIIKDNLTRLIPAIERELREAEIRKQRKIAEKALKESEERYRSLVENINLGITLISSDYKIIMTNNKHRIIHKRAYTATGEHCFKEFEGRESICPHCPGTKAMANRKPAEAEAEGTRSDGTLFPVHIRAFPTFDDNGNTTGFIEVVEDITERKQAEKEKEKLKEQLRQSQKLEAIGTLAGGIAHDFNNILTSIIGYTEIMLFDIPDGSNLNFHLNQVIKASHRAKDLVKQILTFSRQSEQKKILVKVSMIIKEAIKLLRASLPSTIEINYNIENEKSVILGDPTKIHQVLMNLCTNASHAMKDKGGTLEIGLTGIYFTPDILPSYPSLKEGPYVKLTIKDTGHGMDHKTISRIFEPYFTTKKPGEGTGLGLAVVHGIIKAHNGEIQVKSRPGHGTVFQIFLPEAENDETEEIKTPRKLTGGKEHILLVDDEEDLVYVAKLRLERLGYKVTARTDSLEALKTFLENPKEYNLIITDQTMPGLTGVGLAKQLLKIKPDIPIILCTGFCDTISSQQTTDMGIKAFILKPFDIEDIAKTIRTVMEDSER